MQYEKDLIKLSNKPLGVSEPRFGYVLFSLRITRRFDDETWQIPLLSGNREKIWNSF